MEFKPRWVESGRAAIINLSRLDAASAAEVCAHVAAGALPPEVTAELVDPLGRQSVLHGGIDARGVVESLSAEERAKTRTRPGFRSRCTNRWWRASIGLGPARRIVDIGAVIGRQVRL